MWPFIHIANFIVVTSICDSDMSIFTVATVFASFARQSAALTRPKAGPKLALRLRGGGGASHLSDVAIYGGAGLLLIDGAIE